MAKQIVYGNEARAALQAGIDKLSNTVKVTLGPNRGFFFPVLPRSVSR